MQPLNSWPGGSCKGCPRTRRAAVPVGHGSHGIFFGCVHPRFPGVPTIRVVPDIWGLFGGSVVGSKVAPVVTRYIGVALSGALRLFVAAEELDSFPPVRSDPLPKVAEDAVPHHPHLPIQEREELA